MKILDVLNSPWAIQPEKLSEIVEIYSRHLRGDKIDLAGIEAAIGKPLANTQKTYQIASGGVALLPVEGVLAKRMNLFMNVSGGTSLQMLAGDVRKALNDPAVKSLVLVVDSPGGTVDGTTEAARAVLDARGGGKPVVAWVDGTMASGAYWIGSAADAIYAGADTDAVGSIGVATQHVDYSKYEQSMGVTTTDIYAGKYKRIASEHAPLSEEGRAYLQERVDYFYSLFVDAVAQNRGASVEQVLSDMADGRIFIGQQAVSAGLVDGVSTLDALVADLAAGTYRRKRMAGAGVVSVAKDANGAGAALNPEPLPKGNEMDMETLVRDHPQLAETLRAEGAEAERARIKGIEAAALPGHEVLVDTLKNDGKTQPGDAALMILAAEKEKGPRKLAALKDDAATLKDVPAGGSQGGTPAAETTVDSTLPLEERCKATWDKDANVRAAYGGEYTHYLAFEKANAAGRVRELRK